MLSDSPDDARDVEELILQYSRIPTIHKLEPDNAVQGILFAFSMIYYACKCHGGSTKYPTTTPNLVILRTLRAYGLLEQFSEDGDDIEVSIAGHLYRQYETMKAWTEDDLRYDLELDEFVAEIESSLHSPRQLLLTLGDLGSTARQRLVEEHNDITTMIVEGAALSQRADEMLHLKESYDQIILHQHLSLEASLNFFWRSVLDRLALFHDDAAGVESRISGIHSEETWLGDRDACTELERSRNHGIVSGESGLSNREACSDDQSEKKLISNS